MEQEKNIKQSTLFTRVITKETPATLSIPEGQVLQLCQFSLTPASINNLRDSPKDHWNFIEAVKKDGKKFSLATLSLAKVFQLSHLIVDEFVEKIQLSENCHSNVEIEVVGNLISNDFLEESENELDQKLVNYVKGKKENKATQHAEKIKPIKVKDATKKTEKESTEDSDSSSSDDSSSSSEGSSEDEKSKKVKESDSTDDEISSESAEEKEAPKDKKPDFKNEKKGKFEKKDNNGKRDFGRDNNGKRDFGRDNNRERGPQRKFDNNRKSFGDRSDNKGGDRKLNCFNCNYIAKTIDDLFHHKDEKHGKGGRK